MESVATNAWKTQRGWNERKKHKKRETEQPKVEYFSSQMLQSNHYAHATLLLTYKPHCKYNGGRCEQMHGNAGGGGVKKA